MLFFEHKLGLVKIMRQSHQYLGVNNAIASMLAIRGRTAGLRPAEALPARVALDIPESTNEPDLLPLTELRAGSAGLRPAAVSQ